MMDEYNAADFRAELEMKLNIAAAGKLRDYTAMLDEKCAMLDENARRIFLINEQVERANDPAIDWYIQQNNALSMHLDEIAGNESYWKVSEDAGTIEAFLSRVPFLRNTVDGMIAAGKVDVLKRMLSIKEAKPTQRQLVIFYKLLIQEGLFPEINDGSTGKTKQEMCIEIGERHGVSGEKFEQTYNKVVLKDSSIKDLQSVISMLSHSEHTTAKSAAETLLRQTKVGKGIK